MNPPAMHHQQTSPQPPLIPTPTISVQISPPTPIRTPLTTSVQTSVQTSPPHPPSPTTTTFSLPLPLLLILTITLLLSYLLTLEASHLDEQQKHKRKKAAWEKRGVDIMRRIEEEK
jgi:hypothetical protein